MDACQNLTFRLGASYQRMRPSMRQLNYWGKNVFILNLCAEVCAGAQTATSGPGRNGNWWSGPPLVQKQLCAGYAPGHKQLCA